MNIRKVVLFLYLFLFLNPFLYSQKIDELSSTVAYLSEKLPGNQTKSGTGFFITANNKLFLITAQHVSNSLTVNSDITIQDLNDKPFIFKFKDVIRTSTLDWKCHIEGDIALIRLYPNNMIQKKLSYHFLSIDYIYSKDKSISREIPITLLGFPLNLGVKGSFSPISRETRPASGFLTLFRADNKKPAKFFITQDPSIGGFSGAPVFDLGLPIQSAARLTLRNMKPQIVGLVHGTLSDKTGGKFGAIVPSHQIYELIIQNQ